MEMLYVAGSGLVPTDIAKTKLPGTKDEGQSKEKKEAVKTAVTGWRSDIVPIQKPQE